ncbi:cell division septation protein DedD [Rhizobium azooxidifex]|uniref:Cell division septation protein DedD n=1 Tax=Mycoplana azooxidifex TaxID=1636188 RepID=A0A7W6DDJ2_9HYPH|nr:DUF2934 domain-containing protein [Mycoplana azooxidifex]MBB3978687.1 cell division septation protein DedD [Mycoplana azooxidifex]
MTNGSEKQELIRKKAYAIWETEGRPQGQDERHWRQAEEEVETPASTGKPAARKVAAAKPATQKPATKQPAGKQPAKRRAKPAADPA